MKTFMKLLWVVMLGIVAGVTCLEAGDTLPRQNSLSAKKIPR